MDNPLTVEQAREAVCRQLRNCESELSNEYRYQRELVDALIAAVREECRARPNEALRARITDYLGGGGLFNPELANHDAVRDLLIDCRDALAAVPPAGETGEPVAWDIYANGCYIVTARDVEQRDNAAKYQREERGIVAEVRPLYAAPVPAPHPPSAEAVAWEVVNKDGIVELFCVSAEQAEQSRAACDEHLPDEAPYSILPLYASPSVSVSEGALGWLRYASRPQTIYPAQIAKHAAELLRFVEGK